MFLMNLDPKRGFSLLYDGPHTVETETSKRLSTCNNWQIHHDIKFNLLVIFLTWIQTLFLCDQEPKKDFLFENPCCSEILPSSEEH